jgi:hypothetical protein
MALTLVNSIELKQNNPSGTFVAGDVITIFIDDTLIVSHYSFLNFEFTGITTYKNGVEIFSGPFLTFDPSIVSVEINNINICNGTELVKFVTYNGFPYTGYYTVPDSVSCAISPAVCDLIITGVPTFVEPSDTITADGEITVTATSSNAIEYKLNEDFIYGSGQSSGTFTGLLYGNYRIYVRDSKNCAANIFVALTSELTYGTLYRLEYYDLAGAHSKVEIAERDYTGAVEDVCGTGSPVQILLRGEGEDNKFVPVISTQLNLGLISETNQKYINLYTLDPNKYRVYFYKDTGLGYELKWSGKLLPYIYSEDYIAPPYSITVTASDGLAELKDLNFVQKDGLRFYGTMSLIKIIAYCLSYTRLNLNIRVACNMYSTGMDVTDSDDPFDQAYIDTEAFYIDSDAKLSYVIQSILTPFGARLVQWDDHWNIVRVEEMGDTYDYRVFDYNGDYVSTSSFNPVIDIDFPDQNTVMFQANPGLELMNGYGKVTVNYKLGLKSNILVNGDFSLESKFENNQYVPVINKEGWALVNGGYPLLEGYEVIDERNVALTLTPTGSDLQPLGEAYLLSDTYNVKMGINNSLKIKVKYKTSTPLYLSVPYIKLRIMVKYGSLYLTNTGEWTATENIISYFTTEIDKYAEIEIIANQPTSGTPLDGMDLDIRVYHMHTYFAEFALTSPYGELGSLKAQETVSLPIGYRTEYKSSVNIYYYTLQESTDAEDGFNIVRPDDYHATTNPVQWIRYETRKMFNPVTTFSLDSVVLQFLTNGSDPVNLVTRSMTAEPRNRLTYSQDLIIGSPSDGTTTESSWGLTFQPNGYGQIYSDTINYNTFVLSSLSYEIVYAGWLRDSTGAAYDLWTRDGVAESEKLHIIWLKMFCRQYKRSWRMLRAGIVSKTDNFGLLNTFREVNDSNRIYVPVSGTIDDKNNTYNCELLELIDIGTGSDDSGSSPFVSGFSTGFGSDFN